MHLDWIEIIMIIIATGLLGGYVNFVLNRKDGEGLKASLIVGVGASSLVPLFLNTLESDLLKKLTSASEENYSVDGIFVFSGFCLLAAISSRAFIESLSDRVLKEAREAREKVEETQAELERRETKDNHALQLVDIQVAETTDPPFDEATLMDAVKSASPVTQETIYQIAKATRSEAFQAVKRVMESEDKDDEIKREEQE